MSLFGALSSGVSGIRSQSSKIGVISDNISNVNTVGYKAGQGQFETLVTGSGGVTSYSSGGVLPGTRQLIDKQGLLLSTDAATDIAISGDGFFVVNEKDDGTGQTLYTRAGSFRQDSSGNYVNAAGFFLRAWPLDREGRLPGESGNLNTASSANLESLETVNVQAVSGVATATTTLSMGANLKSSQEILDGETVTVDMDILDTANFGISADSVIVPGGADLIQRADKFTVTTGTGLSYSYRYGGFTFSRVVTTGAVGDGGQAVPTSSAVLGANPLATVNLSNVVTVTHAAHGLATGDVVTISGIIGAVNGIPAAEFNTRHLITVLTANTYTITTTTAATATGAGGGAAVSVLMRPFTGNILDATTSTQLLLGTTGTTTFHSNALKFTMNTATTGTVTFTYVTGTPNASLGQFNTLTNLSDAVNAVTGLTARVVSNRLYISAIDANEAITFANSGGSGQAGSPPLSGIDWAEELGLANVAAGSNRFSTMEGLADLVDASTGLDATINNPTGTSTVDIEVTNPLTTIRLQDPAVAAALAPLASATPFTTTLGSNVVTVTMASPHGFSSGDRINLSNLGGGPYNGLTAAQLAGFFEITVTGPSTYTITVSGTAATASGATGAAGLVVTPHNNQGSLLGALGLATSLNSGAYVARDTGALGPAYDAANSSKNFASGAVTAQFSRSVQVIDSLGTAHEFRIAFGKTATNTWAVEIYAVPTTDISTSLINGQVATGTIVFNGDGSLFSATAGLSGAKTINWTNGAVASTVTFGLGTAGPVFGTVGASVFGDTDGLTQFDANYNVNFVTQNGSQVGQLTSVSFTEEGVVVANFSNGQSQELYKIPLGDFSNPNALGGITGNVYSQTSTSGNVTLKEAGDSGVGNIAPSSLESSNVELAEQLTDMIVAQRAYQANTRVITTSDELLEELNRIL